ncbi:odorant receptor 46a-like isoform X2 [Linepithema humile]|uniref:odorant receptor 46a-like isoform X2 n=1 Tax=Linepithema humile TaxID=83485 RepID=UPI00351F4786
MKILTLNFLIYTIGGIWSPIEWSSNGAKLLYNIFTFVILFMLYFLMLTQFTDIIFVVDNVDDFVSNSLMFVSIVAVCCKATIIVTRRSAVINLLQMLLEKPCKPENENEMGIQTKFDEFIRSWTIKYLLLALGSLTSVTIGSVLNAMQGHLPCRVWLPFDTNTPLIFWITSIQQIVTVLFATIINIGTETLVFGLFLQTCAQLEIFEHRLHNLIANKTVGYIEYLTISSSKKEIEISEYVRHHLEIYNILVLCTSIYYISIHIKEAASFLVYTICMFVQIYLYCWSGNEVMLKSKSIGDAIYCTDWPSLSVSEKKDLLIIMKRSTMPITFTSSFLITLTLQSYTTILKTSYSAFNVLQQS